MAFPISTIEYNLKKMIDAGIITESKNFFWSKKGKRIKMYKLSNKAIIISPKTNSFGSEIKQIVPIALISGLFALGLKVYFESKAQISEIFSMAQKSAEIAAAPVAEIPSNSWEWFLYGVFFVLMLTIIIRAVNYFKETK